MRAFCPHDLGETMCDSSAVLEWKLRDDIEPEPAADFPSSEHLPAENKELEDEEILRWRWGGAIAIPAGQDCDRGGWRNCRVVK